MVKSFIQVRELTKHYQMGGTTVRALDGLSLDIDAHTLTVVMGPLGLGKALYFICWAVWTVPRLVRFLWMVPDWMKWMKMRWRSFAAEAWDSSSNPLISSPA